MGSTASLFSANIQPPDSRGRMRSPTLLTWGLATCLASSPGRRADGTVQCSSAAAYGASRISLPSLALLPPTRESPPGEDADSRKAGDAGRDLNPSLEASPVSPLPTAVTPLNSQTRKATIVLGTPGVAQSVEHPGLGFGSAPDLTVRGIEPRVRLCAHSAEPAWDSLSLSLSRFLSPTHACARSLTHTK